MWLLIIILIGVLLFVMFHKPSVNTAGAHWTPPSLPALEPKQKADEAESVEAKPAAMPDTFDFNDLYAPKKPPSDQPRA